MERARIAAIVILLAILCGGMSCAPGLPNDLPALMEAMGSNDMRINFAAAKRVDELYGKEGLLRALEHESANTRAVAAHFLMNHPGAEAQSALLQATRDPNEHVRMWAVFSLGKIGDTVARQRVREMRTDSSPTVSREANEALARLTERLGPDPDR
jgi:hypothetical protein